MARRIQYALPAVEKPSFENRPRGCVTSSPSVLLYGSHVNIIAVFDIGRCLSARRASTSITHKKIPLGLF